MNGYVQHRGQMTDLCSKCTNRKGCNWLAEFCLLTPAQIARTPRLIRGRSAKQEAAIQRLVEMNYERAGIARLGFKKYDKRRKPDNPLRRKWRRQKERQAFWKRADRKRAEG